MAREYAKIRTDIWGDEDWRQVGGAAKLLYFMLLSHATLTYAGVADWRPNRIAPLLDPAWTRADVEALAVELQSRHLVVVNDETEEVLIRSFIKHDGVMRQPRLAVAMASAFSAVSCARIKSVIAFEVQKLRVEDPDLSCWSDARVQTVLDHSGIDLKDLGEGLPSVSATFGPNVGQGFVSPTNTATNTSTEASLLGGEAKLKETRLPADWVPSKNHYDIGRERRLDIAAEADAFRLHAETHDRHAARWNAAFTTWLKKAKPKPSAGGNSWMDRSTQ